MNVEKKVKQLAEDNQFYKNVINKLIQEIVIIKKELKAQKSQNENDGKVDETAGIKHQQLI